MTLIDSSEPDPQQRTDTDEITEKTRCTNTCGPSIDLEAVVATPPVGVLEAFVHEWGAKGEYGQIIRSLRQLAPERR